MADNDLEEYVTYFEGLRCINKTKLQYVMHNYSPGGLSSENRSIRILVSLTSIPDRINEIHYCIYSLLNQETKPDKLILWLGEEQFPQKENNLPQVLLDLKECGLTIRWCREIGSYKKLIPALEQFSNYIIVTADDDIYYPFNWLSELYKSYLQSPQYIHCHRAHRVKFSNDKTENYNQWQHEIDGKYYLPSSLNFPTGCAGVLYPPHVLLGEIQSEKLFLTLCPTADDIWFWCAAVRSNLKINVVDNNIRKLIYINPKRELGLLEEKTLGMINVINGANDVQLRQVIDYFPDLWQKLKPGITKKQPAEYPIPVVFITDESYAEPTAVAIGSMLKNKQISTRYSIFIIGVDLQNVSIRLLESFSCKDASVTVLNFENKYEGRVKEHQHVSSAALLKFDIPNILIHFDKVLYLDSDILVLNDLTELYSTDIEDCYAGVVKDFAGEVIEGHAKKLLLQHYFNSGVMLLNLKNMRLKNVSASMIEWKLQKDTGHFMDQDVINSIFCEQVVYLDLRYNLMLGNLSSQVEEVANYYGKKIAEIEDILFNPTILHLTNIRKPWKYCDAYLADFWFAYRKLIDSKFLNFVSKANNVLSISCLLEALAPENFEKNFSSISKYLYQKNLVEVKTLKKLAKSDHEINRLSERLVHAEHEISSLLARVSQATFKAKMKKYIRCCIPPALREILKKVILRRRFL